MSDEPHIRVLIDRRTQSVYEVDDYVGDPEEDFLLREVVRKANQKAGTDRAVIGGLTPEESTLGDMFVARVPRKHWNIPGDRKRILSQLGAAHTGFEELFYDVKNTFMEDAQECYTRHNRPKGACIDWEDESKLVGNAMLTSEDVALAEREGLPVLNAKGRQVKRYLCHYCPVKAGYVDPGKRKQAGLYN